MTTTKTMWAFAMVVSLAACGVDPRNANRGDRNDEPQQPQPTMRADVRLRAVSGQKGFQAALLDVKDFVVTTPDGTPLRTHTGQRNIDLANEGQAWLVGGVDIPEGVEKVIVQLRLDDYGGWEDKKGAGYIDARYAMIRFEAPVSWLMERKMATVILDLDRSLVAGGGERRVLVPQLQLAF